MAGLDGLMANGLTEVRSAYTRDAAGNPTAIERESGLGVFYYQYDKLQRLSYEGQFVGGAPQYQTYYGYDPAGNRSAKHHLEGGDGTVIYYTYNAANELTQRQVVSSQVTATARARPLTVQHRRHRLREPFTGGALRGSEGFHSRGRLCHTGRGYGRASV